jgi:hypothetical protein
VTADCGRQGSSSNIAFTRCTVRAITAILKRSSGSAKASMSSEPAYASHVLHVSRPTSPRRRSLGLPAVSIEAQSPFCLPPQDDTIALIHKYFNTTGELFPFIYKEGFLKEYQDARLSNFSKVSRTWLGLLYMVLAMAINAANDGDVTAAQRRAESDVFYQRARAVCERSVRKWYASNLRSNGDDPSLVHADNYRRKCNHCYSRANISREPIVRLRHGTSMAWQ